MSPIEMGVSPWKCVHAGNGSWNTSWCWETRPTCSWNITNMKPFNGNENCTIWINLNEQLACIENGEFGGILFIAMLVCEKGITMFVCPIWCLDQQLHVMFLSNNASRKKDNVLSKRARDHFFLGGVQINGVILRDLLLWVGSISWPLRT